MFPFPPSICNASEATSKEVCVAVTFTAIADCSAGMSAVVSIDTGRTRSFRGLWSDLTGWAASWFDGAAQSKQQ